MRDLVDNDNDPEAAAGQPSTSHATPSPKKSGRMSLIAELDRSYYSVGPGPAKKLCPSTSPCSVNGNEVDETAESSEVRIQIETEEEEAKPTEEEEEERTVEGSSQIQYEEEIGEFVEGTPPVEARKRSSTGDSGSEGRGSRKISDYFSKLGK